LNFITRSTYSVGEKYYCRNNVYTDIIDYLFVLCWPLPHCRWEWQLRHSVKNVYRRICGSMLWKWRNCTACITYCVYTTRYRGNTPTSSHVSHYRGIFPRLLRFYRGIKSYESLL